MPLLNTTSYSQVVNGAYVIKPETNKLDGIIVATGSEVIVACSIVNDLYSRFNMDFRVVSMPSRELFIRTKSEYQNNVLPKGVKTFVLEAASSYEMLEFATDREYLLNITKFGISSTKSDVDKYVDFDYLSLEERIYRLMKN